MTTFGGNAQRRLRTIEITVGKLKTSCLMSRLGYIWRVLRLNCPRRSLPLPPSPPITHEYPYTHTHTRSGEGAWKWSVATSHLISLGTTSDPVAPNSFEFQDWPNGPLRLSRNCHIYLCFYHVCRCVLHGLPSLCFLSWGSIVYSARLSMSLTYQVINLKSEKFCGVSKFFPTIISPFTSWG